MANSGTFREKFISWFHFGLKPESETQPQLNTTNILHNSVINLWIHEWLPPSLAFEPRCMYLTLNDGIQISAISVDPKHTLNIYGPQWTPRHQLRMPQNLLAAMVLLFNPGLLGCTSSINLSPQNVSHYKCQHLPPVCQTSHCNIQQSILSLISTYLETSCLDLHHHMQILTHMTRQSTVTSLPNSFKVNI